MPGPLAGVRVVELAGLGPAPFACMLLAQLGADVIAVDRPGRQSAAWSPPEHDLSSRGRPRICVDLKQPAGVDLVRTMAGDVPTSSSRASAPVSPSASASDPTTCSRPTSGWCTAG